MIDRRTFMRTAFGGTIFLFPNETIASEDTSIDDRPIIKTMKDTKYFKDRILNKDNRTFFCCSNLNSFQVYSGEKKYYKEVNGDQRGALSNEKNKLKPYEIWTCPGMNLFSDDIKRALLTIIKEKVYNSLNTANCLLKELKKDNMLVENNKWPDYDEELDMEDFISFLTSKRGQIYINEKRTS